MLKTLDHIIKGKIKITILSEKFLNPIEKRKNRQNHINTFMTVHFPGLVQALKQKMAE
jgi:hypothetical protein